MNRQPTGPLGDPGRLQALKSFEIVDTSAEANFDRLTSLAAMILDIPVSLVSLVTDDRQFFKSCVGLPEPWATDRETPLSHSFCRHVVESNHPLIIEDAREHPLVCDNLAITDLGVIAYLGIPLIIEEGHVLGSFCAIDTKPKRWTDREIQILANLAASVMTELRLRRELKTQIQLREVIAEQRDSLEVMLTSIGDAVIATDPHGVVTFLNPVAESLTAWDELDAIGKPVESVFQIVDERSRTSARQAIRKVLEGGMPQGLASPMILVARDGTERPISDNAAPIKSDSGETRGAILVFRDVSRQMEAKRAIEAAKTYAENIVDSMREPLLILDARLEIRSANRTFYETFHTSQSETEGRSLDNLDSGRWEIPELRSILETVASGLAPVEDCEVEHDFPTLGRRIVQFNARRIADSSADSTLILLAIDDITDRKNSERTLAVQAASLQENDRRRNEFLAMLAHELRNPVGAISNAARLSKVDADGEIQTFSRDVIQRQVIHLTHLIDDLLDVSRVGQGKITLRPTTLRLDAIVEQAIELVQPTIDRKSHELTVRVSNPSLLFEGDKTRVEQILGNLLTNAAKYTEPGGRISFEATKDGTEIVFSIRDNGVGIASEMLPKVFGLFTQIDSSIERSHGGLGIGLTLVENLVRMHGGTVQALSEGEGRGSEFLVRLPIGNPASRKTEPEPKVITPSKKRILVVDDNQDSVKLSARLLSSMGYTVKTAFDGHQAVDVARGFEPDVILLDIGLPGLNGYEVAATLKHDEACARTTLIAITGYGEEAALQRASDAGFHHHLTKPVDFDRLTALIEAVPVEPDPRG